MVPRPPPPLGHAHPLGHHCVGLGDGHAQVCLYYITYVCINGHPPPPPAIPTRPSTYTPHTHENRGDVAELKKRGEKPPSPTASFSAAARDWRTWVLALQVGR